MPTAGSLAPAAPACCPGKFVNVGATGSPRTASSAVARRREYARSPQTAGSELRRAQGRGCCANDCQPHAEDGGEDPPRGDFAVPGMYGGFYGVTVNRDESGTWGLDCESWCRVAGGSGQRHRITADETTLVEEGFC